MNESERRLLEADAQRRMPTGETERPKALDGIRRVIFDVRHGAKVEDAIKEGIQFSSRTGFFVGFDFNGVNVLVDVFSNPELIVRDYQRAASGCIKGEVGPYPEETLSKRTLARDARIIEERQRRIDSLGKTPEASK